MNENEYIQHWNYFCSIARLLDETQYYVYHGFKAAGEETPRFVNENVCSDAFKQIILLSCAEFEIVCKSLCAVNGQNPYGIIGISKTILSIYPKIVQTHVMTMYMEFAPLDEWSVDEDNKVHGLDWWSANNHIKHDDKDSYSQAALMNAILSVGSLYIVNLYLMYVLFESTYLASAYPPVYFRCKYISESISSSEGLLPDWGDMTAFEKAKSRFDSFSKPFAKE